MDYPLRFPRPCPKCEGGYISLRFQTDLLTDKSNLTYECYKCGYKLKDYKG